MSRVKGRDTGTEKRVRSLLHRMGYRFRLHRKDLPGNPDIVLSKYKKIIFIHGCFWHGHVGCKRAERPATNIEFWNRKLDGNVARDKETERRLNQMGWDVLVVWQCQTRDITTLAEQLHTFIKNTDDKGVL